ncbi:UPF0102 protein [Bacteroidia bacterium]|nr:UPF0102 protein [Bacteroidia bacterium]
MNTLEAGKRGEEAAKNYLIQNGFTIRDCNWRYGHKELDILAVKNNTLHVVEVKSRSANFLVAPERSIDRQKQRNTILAANAYVHRFRLSYQVQLDVIIVIFNGDDAQITYIPSAFYPVARYK